MIISINGKISSGKDTVGRIIQYLTSDMYKIDNFTYQEWLNYGKTQEQYEHKWEIKKFAGKLKLVASLLTGIPVEKFEDQEFKKQFMPDEWNSFVSIDFPEMTGEEIKNSDSILVKTTHKRMTYREFLQRLGTEAMRDGLHTNVWVNALFSDYIPVVKEWDEFGNDKLVEYPSWCITDMRFPNEMDAVEQRKGITIRVVRNPIIVITLDGEKLTLDYNEWLEQKQFYENQGWQFTEHPSETALDDAEFDYEIINNGSIEDLVEKVREILITEKII
jgi:hypothetical protein